jgi:2-polyprenyl-3-methyl-5-hydroxy-6-metoxy-1,4-benzoquinol methylase
MKSRAQPVPMPYGDPVAVGHYARKQLFSKSAIIAWSHRSRFRTARRLLLPYAGKRLVDYGCGDGTLLTTISDIFVDAVGVDLDPRQLDDCRRRFATLPKMRFLTVGESGDGAHDAAYDVVTCMEVLEHCPDSELGKVIDDLSRLVTADGVVIISVPVEIGPALLGKHVMRAIASWRSLDDYKWRDHYTARELLRSVAATNRTMLSRDVSANSLGAFHTHKGFNWRALKVRLCESFEVSDTFFSPFDLFRGLFSSQAWFVCKRR